MQIERTMRLTAMQENRDSRNRDVRDNERINNDFPARRTRKTIR